MVARHYHGGMTTTQNQTAAPKFHCVECHEEFATKKAARIHRDLTAHVVVPTDPFDLTPRIGL